MGFTTDEISVVSELLPAGCTRSAPQLVLRLLYVFHVCLFVCLSALWNTILAYPRITSRTLRHYVTMPQASRSYWKFAAKFVKLYVPWFCVVYVAENR